MDLAIRHALDLASTRGSRLAAVTLRSGDPPDAVEAVARACLRRHRVEAEIRVIRGPGAVELACVELLPQ